MDTRRTRLTRANTALLVIDIQERLCSAMDQQKLPRFYNRTKALIEGAKALGLPIVVTEQYPRGLGPTVPQIVTALPQGAGRVEKAQFSCIVPEVTKGLGLAGQVASGDASGDGTPDGRSQILLCGMETHVCVFQTARDLLELGLVPFLCTDALLSRHDEDRSMALARANEIGAVVTTVESALFDLLGKAGGPEFKQISAAVK